jgi:hypothetical protein
MRRATSLLRPSAVLCGGDRHSAARPFRAFTRCGRRSERLLRNGAYAFLADSDEAAKVRSAPHRAACARGDAARTPFCCQDGGAARFGCQVCLPGVLRIVDRRDYHEQNAQARQRDRGAGRTHSHTHTRARKHTHARTHTHTHVRANTHAILLQAGSKFSKTTFQSKDSNALIGVNDSKCATACNRQHADVATCNRQNATGTPLQAA